MSLEISWSSENGLTRWNDLFRRVRRANLLQSPDYTRAVCAVTGQQTKHGIITIDGQDAGVFQLLESGRWLRSLCLDRAPLWLEGFGRADHETAFFSAFNKLYPVRPWQKRRIIPETSNQAALAGYKRLDRSGYQTIWIDLTQDEQALRAQLKPNWRNKLRKAERGAITVEFDTTAKHLPWLLKRYDLDKKQRGYAGASTDLLAALAGICAKSDNMVIGRALVDARPVAATLVLCHGAGATSQVAWVSDEGRETAAYHRLLWETMMRVKASGIKDFDCGGVNDASAYGVKIFKQGLGGELVTLAGTYR